MLLWLSLEGFGLGKTDVVLIIGLTGDLLMHVCLYCLPYWPVPPTGPLIRQEAAAISCHSLHNFFLKIEFGMSCI